MFRYYNRTTVHERMSGNRTISLRLSVCLFVHLSQSGEAWERVNGVAAGCFQLVDLFAC